jgi:TonB family protein|nr:TonB family protein [Candidatus Krumholzibacteria bacterium]
MMQQHIDRAAQTGGGMTASLVLHVGLLLVLVVMAGGKAAQTYIENELTEIAYIEARYGEDVAAKVKLKEPARRPEPPGRGVATDSAMKPAEPKSPEPPRPEPKPLTKKAPKIDPIQPTKRVQVAVADIVVPDAQPKVQPKALAQAPQLEAKVPVPANRKIIDPAKLKGTALAKELDNVKAPARAATRPVGQFKPQSGALKSKSGGVALGSEIDVASSTSRRSGGVAEVAGAVPAGGGLQQNSRSSYQAPAAALAPAGQGGGVSGGQGVLDVDGPTGGGSKSSGGRKTILNYGSGSGGRGGSLAGRARLAEPEPTKDIVAATAAEPETRQVAEVKLDGKGVGMTISGQIQGRKILKSVAPEYTALARRKGWEGAVAVHFTVLADGRVKDNAYFEQTSVHRDLNKMAMDAIKQFRFAPLGAGQAAVEQWGVITIVFRLN